MTEIVLALITVIGSIIAAALGGGVVTWILSARQQKNKLAADAHKAEAEADEINASMLLKTMRSQDERIDRMQKRIDDLESKLEKSELLRAAESEKVDKLTERVRELEKENTDLRHQLNNRIKL